MNFESINPLDNHIGMNNLLQVELAKRHEEYAELSEDDAVMAWIQNYSAKFRDVINAKAQDNPNLWSELEDGDFRSDFLIELEIELRKQEQLKEAA